MPETMPDLEALRERFKNHNLSAVARETGLHYSSVYEFVKGKVHPKYGTVQRLMAYLVKEESTLD